MMNASETIKLMTIAGAGVIALFCCLIMVINRFDTNINQPKKTSVIVAVMFLCASFSWFSALIYLIHPKAFFILHPLMYLAMLYYEVLLYRFIFLITQIKENEHFGIWHFIVPLIIVGGVFCGAFFVPYDVQMTIIESKGEVYGDYKLYALLMTSKAFTFFVYNIVYSLLCLLRIKRYQIVIPNYSADEGRSPVRWLYLLFYISLGTLPVVLLGSFLGKNPLFNTIALVFPVMMSTFQEIIICYNMAAGNYKIIAPERISMDDKAKNKVGCEIIRKKFERYMRISKPYLRTDLHVVDMAADLVVDRSTLTNFIREEYEMSFSRYVNLWRLKELRKLQANADLDKYSGLELVQKAGFSSYKGYLLVKKQEDRDATIRINRTKDSQVSLLVALMPKKDKQ